MTRGRWRLAAGLGFFFLAGALAVSAIRAERPSGGPQLSAEGRRYPAGARKTFVTQVRAADGSHELAGVEDVELVNRGAAYCAELARTRSSLQAMTNLGLAGQAHQGDVYIVPPAKRLFCPDLPDEG